MGPDELPAFGTPWRLHLLGDPLYRVDLRVKAPRVPAKAGSETWPAYTEEPAPASDASDSARLAWAVKATLLDAAKAEPVVPTSIENSLLSIRREALPANLRPVLDGLRIDALPRSRGRSDEFLAVLAAVPPTETSPRVARAVVSAQMARFRRAIEANEWGRALKLWEAIIAREAPDQVRVEMTTVLGKLLVKLNRKPIWELRLKEAIAETKNPAESRYLRDELDRTEKAKGPAAKPSVRRE